MTVPTINITQSAVLAALRTVLISMIPAGTEVIRGEVNRVPMPLGPNFLVFWPIMRIRLSTEVETYSDLPGNGDRMVTLPTQLTVQLDIHGPRSAETAQIITTLFGHEYTMDAFNALGVGVQPLYASDPRETPFTGSEQQAEQRWSLDLELQVDQMVTVDQEFMDTVTVGIFEVDATYPLPPPAGDVGRYNLSKYNDGSVYG